MKFYLLKDKPFCWQQTRQQDEQDLEAGVVEVRRHSLFHMNGRQPIQLTPIMTEKKDGVFWDADTLKKCADVLSKELNAPRRGNGTVRSSIIIGGSMVPANITLNCQRGKDNKLTFSVHLSQQKFGLLERLYQVCERNVKLEVELYFKTAGEFSTLAACMTKGMPVISSEGGSMYSCSETEIQVTECMEKYYNGYFASLYGHTCGSINIIAVVDHEIEIFAELFKDDVPRKILETGVASDFEIVASNGIAIRCHKCFLAVNSPVLDAMLSIDMSERSTNQVKMEDVSEAGVRAFLAYLYCGELTEPKANLELAFELLYTGHKYGVKRLEQSMIKMLENKQDIYFTAEFAMKMFRFVRNMQGGESLKEKAMRILSMESPIYNLEYEELCREDPVAATELFESALTALKNTPAEVVDIDMD